MKHTTGHGRNEWEFRGDRTVKARTVSRWAQRNTTEENGKAFVSTFRRGGREYAAVKVVNTETGKTYTRRIRVGDASKVIRALSKRFGAQSIWESR